MSEERTIPAQRTRVPVGTLRVDVVSGPDAGLVHRAEKDTVAIGTAQGNDLVLTDPTVSRYHVQLTCHGDEVVVVDHGSTNGTHVAGARIERARVAGGAVLSLGNTSIRITGAGQVDVELAEREAYGRLRGRSSAMRRLMAEIDRVASSDAAVLLVGESGTGKELIAEAIHEHSPRRAEPFVTVDCGALSPTLVASELFGHEKGAFTGADRQHVGAFERAHGGTIFLDEIGELPPSLQPVLLGVLERRRFRRVGGTADISSNVRLVSATNRDLRAEVNANNFRLDLYYRTAVVTLHVPPLRDRADDIPVLFEHFLRESGHAEPVENYVSRETLRTLCKHRWPGNVRELRNLVEATLAMGVAPDPEIASPPAERRVSRAKATNAAATFDALVELPYRDARQSLLNDFEAHYLAKLLERTAGNISGAARLAKMDRSYLVELLRRHKLKA